MRALTTFFAIVISIASVACGHRNRFPEEKFPTRMVTLRGVSYGYRLYLPENRVAGQKVPVMLYLHGSNRRGTDNGSQLEDLAETLDGERSPVVIVFPQCRPDSFWAGPDLEQAIAALDQTVNEFNGDPSRLYLAGYSMGGSGTWQAAVTYPDKFAALVPVAGGIEPVGEPSEADKALLSPAVQAAETAPDPYAAFAAAIGNTPVWVFHGAKDEAVPVAGARRIVEALRTAGNGRVRYTEFENVGHGSVVKAFTEPGLYQWLTEQSRSNSK